MGVDFRGTLYWGFPLLVDDEEDGNSYLTDGYYDIYDIIDPNNECKEEREDGDLEWETVYQKRTGKEVGIKPPVQLYYGGYEDGETWYVFIDESAKVVENGEHVAVPTEVGESWEQQLQEFCAELSIPWQTPGWYVTTLIS